MDGNVFRFFVLTQKGNPGGLRKKSQADSLPAGRDEYSLMVELSLYESA